MKPTTETRNVSSQPECLEEKRYEVVLDLGKPSSWKVSTLDEVKSILIDGFIASKSGDYPEADAFVYLDGKDISEDQVIQEMIGEIMDEDFDINPFSNAGPTTGACSNKEELKKKNEEERFKDNPHRKKGIRCDRYDGDCIGCMVKAVPDFCGKWDGAPSEQVRGDKPETFWIDLEAAGRPRLLPMPERKSLLSDLGKGSGPALQCSACGKSIEEGKKLGNELLCESCWELDPR